jgi:flagellar protein FlgJ
MKPGRIREGTSKPSTIELPTNEFIQGKGMVKMRQPFLNNKNIEDSITQHKLMFYLLDRYKDLPKCKSFIEIATEVHDAGYATDPRYAQKLVEIYERHNLDKL